MVDTGGVDALLNKDRRRANVKNRPDDHSEDPAANALEQSIFTDITSVMNLGIMLGALAAAGLARQFAPSFKLPLRSLLAAVIGGLLLGYGPRIAFGCNIGAFFGGISSTSLHGWLWFAAAFLGSILGTRMRPYFGLR